jgi:hypothetical protein
MLGVILATMPVSESGVERIFSHLRDLLLSHREAMQAPLLDAKLVIKLNNYLDKATCEDTLQALDAIDPGGLFISPIGEPGSQGQPVDRLAGQQPAAEPLGQVAPAVARGLWPGVSWRGGWRLDGLD